MHIRYTLMKSKSIIIINSSESLHSDWVTFTLIMVMVFLARKEGSREVGK